MNSLRLALPLRRFPPGIISSFYCAAMSSWTFGFGSNMSISNVENKKGHKVLDHVTGVVHGYKMCFNIDAIPRAEPAFANAVKGSDDDSIHGVAIKLSDEDMEKLTAQEISYDKVLVTVKGYDGRVVEDCAMFMNTTTKMLPPEKQTPSARYLALVVRGAVESGLDEAYINKLRQTKTYTPDKEAIARRKTLPAGKDLPPMSVNELRATRAETLGKEVDGVKTPGEFAFVAILGYIIKMERAKCTMMSHLGRDITSRNLRQWRGLPLDKDDDMGQPPYPDVLNLPAEEMEFIYSWLDHYLDKGQVVGYIKEFADQIDVKKIM